MGKSAKRAARERLAEQRRREAARRRRNRTILVIVIAIVVIAGGTGIGIAVARHGSGSSPTASKSYNGPYAPITIQPKASTITMAKSGVTKPELDVYEDFQCPYCKHFESANGGDVQKLAYQGKVKVVYHLMSFVNQTGSPRAAAAAMCAPDDKFLKYHNALYAKQPDEKSAFSWSTLKDIASGVGITSKKFTSCVDNQTYLKPAKDNSERLLKSKKISGTPTLFLNGKQLDMNTALTAGKVREQIVSAQ